MRRDFLPPAQFLGLWLYEASLYSLLCCLCSRVPLQSPVPWSLFCGSFPPSIAFEGEYVWEDVIFASWMRLYFWRPDCGSYVQTSGSNGEMYETSGTHHSQLQISEPMGALLSHQKGKTSFCLDLIFLASLVQIILRLTLIVFCFFFSRHYQSAYPSFKSIH